jgi:hypothetical protein
MPLFASFLDALSWQEWAVPGIIGVLLFGPLLWRMLRR